MATEVDMNYQVGMSFDVLTESFVYLLFMNQDKLLKGLCSYYEKYNAMEYFC